MHRRKFITLAALGTPVALAADEKDEPPHEAWWGTVESPEKYTAESGEGNIKLNVELFFPPDDKVKEVADPEGFTSYHYDGKKLPERWWKGESLLTKFELLWDGKPVPIEKRFWSDLAGFRIQVSPLEIKDVAEKHVAAFLEFLGSIHQPRVSLSADKGTILIEWNRSEECDSRSTIRWMVSRSGTVLRHRISSDGC
jgi:hypothetical protein